MKEFKGSAGPWSAHDDEESMATSVVMNEFGDILCVVGTYMTSTEEDYANANLIAAAPDLLEALQDLLIRVADDEEYGPEHAITRARAAISKALGEE
ncbi:hypothetical protein ACLEZA_17795 [Enterobacter ludwigii]|uniref:hypothetical protein n=1 Tax=Enterobacter ludwigii TaxID=299767 RepID=UPI003975164E